MKKDAEARELTGKEKRLANLKPAKPGEVRNPNGSSVPKDIRALRTYTNADVERKLHKLLQMNTVELKTLLESAQVSTIERLLGMIIYKGIAQGDTVRAAFVLERAGCRLPPMPQPININMHLSNIQNMSTPDLIDLGEEAIRVLAAANQPVIAGDHDD